MKKDFSNQRALIQYVDVNVRPDVCATIQQTETNQQLQMNSIRSKVHQRLEEHQEPRIEFPTPDLPSARIVLINGVSFLNGNEMKTQLGRIIIMVDKNKHHISLQKK